MCVVHGFAFGITSRKRKPQHVVQTLAQRCVRIPDSLPHGGDLLAGFVALDLELVGDAPDALASFNIGGVA